MSHDVVLDGATSAEWERIELLGRCAAQLRQGLTLEPPVLDRLRDLHAAVQLDRQRGRPWARLCIPALGQLDYDLLACTLAPEIEPRVGWLFQQLQGGAVQPYPSAALVQEMLAMSPREAPALAAALAEGALLRRLGLLDVDGGGPYAPIRPARGLSARLLGIPETPVPPPGAIRVTLDLGWNELVLPADRLALVRELLHWIEHRRTVVETWGGRAVGGPLALFAGPSGTGKTLAAAVIAKELGWPLYRVDLGMLVSKYIGETEKNLNRLFAAAHGRSMILQFDEADSLFGKRGEVKEARDRYANLEVSHLLSRVEQHEGPIILTTNLRGHLDAAFARRFQVVIEFSRPEAAARAKLWEIHLPPRAPRAADIDCELLGRAVNLTGGEIRNAALHAAYLAAGGRGILGLGEIAVAVHRELSKEGRAPSAADLGPLATHLPEDIV